MGSEEEAYTREMARKSYLALCAGAIYDFARSFETFGVLGFIIIRGVFINLSF